MYTLREIYDQTAAAFWCDKGSTHSYIGVYEEMLEPIRMSPINLLEIGVFEGGSLFMWHRYLQNAQIYGIDNGTWKENRSKAKFELTCRLDRVHYIEADATDRERIEDLLPDTRFDVIIDDGSHNLEDQQASLSIFWKMLRTGGTYIIEDIRKFEWIEPLSLQWLPQPNVIDLRCIKGRHDDIMMVWKKQ